MDQYAANGQADRYADIARDVVRSTPDVNVIAISHPLIAQLAKETSTIPIVAVVGDPVALGLVQNLARPERNITGIAADAGIEMQGKHLDILRQAVPSASRIAYLSPREEHAADKAVYALRNRIERFFNRVKNSRGVATRYDKLIESFAAFVLLASIRIWIRFVHTT